MGRCFSMGSIAVSEEPFVVLDCVSGDTRADLSYSHCLMYGLIRMVWRRVYGEWPQLIAAFTEIASEDSFNGPSRICGR